MNKWLMFVFFPSLCGGASIHWNLWNKYGRIADNIPSPDKVNALIRGAKMKNMKKYDADHDVIKAFRGTGLELVVVALLNGYLQAMGANEDQVMNWVKENVQAFLPDTLIRGICVGNEVLHVAEFELWGALLGAVKNIYKAVKKLQLADLVQITTPHAQAVFVRSCTCEETVKQKYMKPFLELFAEIVSLLVLTTKVGVVV
ncbi:hypothetical protein ACE6H2_025530 [Prunus campanulata]